MLTPGPEEGPSGTCLEGRRAEWVHRGWAEDAGTGVAQGRPESSGISLHCQVIVRHSKESRKNESDLYWVVIRTRVK